MIIRHNYLDLGSGPVLVFIHGAYIDSNIWRKQIPYFEQNFRIINYDLRGHGLTQAKESKAEYSVELFAEDLRAFLDERGVESAFFCGLSLGSMIAQAFAARYPQRCEGIILVGTSASFRNTYLEKIALNIFFPKWLALRIFSKLTTRQFMKLAFFMTWFAYGKKWLGTKETKVLIRECMQRMRREEIKKVFAALHSFRKQNLNNGDYDVLIIIGEFDSWLLHYHSRWLQEKLQDRSQLIVIPDSGHACNVDQPVIFNDAVESWINKRVVRLPQKVVL